MKELSNASILWVMIIIGLIYIAAFAALYLYKAYTRCLEMGITKEKLGKVIKSSLVFTIVPSLSIVVGLFVLIANLGLAWSTWRLSVIGSLSYETIISQSLAGVMGVANTTDMTTIQFGVVMILMSIGMLGGFLILIPFGKKFCMATTKKTTGSTWSYVLSGVFMLCLFAVYIPVLLVGDFTQAAVMITGLVVALGIGFLSANPKLRWLGEFTMALSMIAAMASSLMWVGIFG